MLVSLNCFVELFVRRLSVKTPLSYCIRCLTGKVFSSQLSRKALAQKLIKPVVCFFFRMKRRQKFCRSRLTIEAYAVIVSTVYFFSPNSRLSHHPIHSFVFCDGILPCLVIFFFLLLVLFHFTNIRRHSGHKIINTVLFFC